MSELRKRYSSFLTMLLDQKQDSYAFAYEENGVKKYLTYAELIRKIYAFPLKERGTAGILMDGSLASILAVFAYASKHRQIALLSPLEELDSLKDKIKAADVNFILGPNELKEALKDSLVTKEATQDGKILFFTSGTTNSNKAVCLSEASLCSSAYNGASLLPLSPNDVLYSCLPFNHVFGFVCSLLWGLSCGACVALSRGVKQMFGDFAYFKPTAVSLVPQMASFFASRHLFNPELKLVLIGAGDCSDSVLQTISSQGIRVCFGYGLTETSSGVALSIGKDPRAMSLCPDVKVTLGPDEEILLDCKPVLMSGYYKDEASTKEALHDGILSTGDLGYFDSEGLLHIKGRKKDILVLDDGTKIYCPEYESKLAAYLGADKDFAIAKNGKGQIVLAFGKATLQDNYSSSITAFNETVPYSNRVAVVLYFPGPLPRTQTGKIKRWALQKMI